MWKATSAAGAPIIITRERIILGLAIIAIIKKKMNTIAGNISPTYLFL